jgi:site-specific DNA-methyltransferase (adenine-specific)
LPEESPLKANEIGLEQTPDEYVANMVQVFREARRILRDDGTIWINIGDSYASQGGKEPPQSKWNREGIHDGQNGGMSRRPPPGIKPKDLIGIPWMLAFALRAEGWYLRSDIIWHKPSPLPESVKDRPTRSHEYIFLLSKKEKYYFDAESIAEPSVAGFNGSSFTKGKTLAAAEMLQPVDRGERIETGTRNKRSVWTVPTKPFKGAHFAVMPPALAEPCILAGCPKGGVVIDPFMGSGTTAYVAAKHGRNSVGIELNDNYLPLIRERMSLACPPDDLFSALPVTQEMHQTAFSLDGEPPIA